MWMQSCVLASCCLLGSIAGAERGEGELAVEGSTAEKRAGREKRRCQRAKARWSAGESEARVGCSLDVILGRKTRLRPKVQILRSTKSIRLNYHPKVETFDSQLTA